MQFNKSMVDHKCYGNFNMGGCSNMRPCMLCYYYKMCPMIHCCPMETPKKFNKTKENNDFDLKNISIKAVDISEIKD